MTQQIVAARPIVCGFCGVSSTRMHRDHIIPRSRGGGDDARNSVWSCSSCNLSKSDMAPSEWRYDLPEWIYRVENQLAIRYRMFARKAPRPRPIEIRCGFCDFDLTRDHDLGVVRVEARRDVVEWFGVLCEGCSEEREGEFACFYETDVSYVRDHVLSVVLGENASSWFWQLSTAFVWPNELVGALFDFFALAGQVRR